MFERHFVTAEEDPAYQDAVIEALRTLTKAWPKHPYTGSTVTNLGKILNTESFSDRGLPLGQVMEWVAKAIENSVSLSHPDTLAHLQCAPVIPALAAEVVLSALNQSMDSFDQAPAATLIEKHLINQLCGQAGLPNGAAGTFTTGGTQSNYMALLLARDACIKSRWNWNVQRLGLPPEASRLRIVCSEAAHFTIEKSAAQLGLGTQAVMRVGTDDQFRMRPQELTGALRGLETKKLIPMAVVATAGTTDFGSIDPIVRIAKLAHDAGAWLHVDGAYGGALMFSQRHRARLNGIEHSDSFSVDFHKLLWQPISCAVFLIRDPSHFRYIKMHSDYLNPESQSNQGIPNLVEHSLLTTRRFDALKLLVSIQVLGREELGAMIDRTLELAKHAAQFIRSCDCFELLHEPTLGCVVFRFRPRDCNIDSDSVNVAIRSYLFNSGRAVIGFTRVHGRQCLKLTCLNPCANEQQLEALLKEIGEIGGRISSRSTTSNQ